MKRVTRSHLPVTAMSHPGMRGKNNEDRYGITAFRIDKNGRQPALLAVLCDGIGGHRAGEIAAEIAVNRISAVIEETGSTLAPVDALQNAIQTASEAIYRQAQANRHQEGMGATCTCAWIIRRNLYLASVGDTRAYLLRDGGIRQLTTDHTWVQEAIDKGVLTRQEAEGHPNTHVIRRFLGSPQPPVADLRLRLDDRESDQAALANQGMTLRDGDLLLLCSDGLTDLVTDEEIASALYSYPVEEAAAALIELANSRGGHDNITLVIIQVPNQARKRRRSRAVWVLAGVLILLTAGVLAGWWLDRSTTQPSPTIHPTQTMRLTLELPAGAATLTSPAIYPTSTFPPLPTVAITPSPPLPATLTPWPTNTPNS